MRVVVAAESKALRETICQCLEQARDIVVAGEKVDVKSTLACPQTFNPDVIVIHDDLPPLRSGHAAAYIKSQGISSLILSISRELDPVWVHHSYRLGVNGFLHKDELDECLAEAVRVVQRGTRYFSPKAWVAYHSIIG